MAFALLSGLLLASCSGDKTADAADILATIPSDASAVAVFNTGAILEKSGCKIDGAAITPSDEATAAVARIRNAEIRKLVQNVLSGKSGVNPSVAVVFRQGYYNYLTGMLSTPADFKAMAEAELGAKFVASEGVETAGNVAVADERFWINLDQHAIDVNDIRHFISLDRQQSFLSNKFADRMSEVKKDVEGWGNISGIINTLDLGFQERATAQIALQTLFEDPQSISFSAEIKKNELKAEASVLDSKGGVAKYQLTPGKIDVNTVNSLGGDAAWVAAVDIPAKMVAELKKQTDSKSPSMLGIVLGSMGSVDGTAAFALGQTGRGVISTDGKDSSALSNMLSQVGMKVEKQGQQLRVSFADTARAADMAPVSQLAAGLDGAVAGIATHFGPGNPFKAGATVTLTLTRQGKGLGVNLLLVSADKNENLLFCLL